MRKFLIIYEDLRRPLVIYDFATAPFRISLYMRKILFIFLLVQWCRRHNTNDKRVTAKAIKKIMTKDDMMITEMMI